MSCQFVSIVVPVYNNKNELLICLEALSAQTYPKDRYEVIVVDNGSTDGTREICFGLGAKSKEHRREQTGAMPSALCPMLYLYEPQKGSYNARNTGIKAAKGEILAFTDADCIPAPDWIEKGVEALLNTPNCGLVGGRIDVFAEYPDRPTAVELFEILTAFRQEEYIKRWHFGATANVFTKREVIDKEGYLNGALKSGGDLEWGGRVFKAGYNQVYADDAIVRHPARKTLRDISKKHRRVIRGLYASRNSEKYPPKEFLIDLKDDWPRIKDFRGLLNNGEIRLKGKLKAFAIMLIVKIVRGQERITPRSDSK